MIILNFLEEKSKEIDTEDFLPAGKISNLVSIGGLLYMLKWTKNEHFFTDDEKDCFDVWILNKKK